MQKVAVIAAIFLMLAGGALAIGIIVGPFESREQMLPVQHDPVFYNNLGYRLAQDGNTVDAQAAFSRAVELKSDYERARSNLATIAFQNEDYTTAIAQLRWLTTHSESVEYKFDLAQNLVAQARYVDADMDKLDEAVSIFESLGDYPNAANNAQVVRNVIADVNT